MSYSEEYARHRKNSWTEESEDEDPEQAEIQYENDRLDFLHSVHELHKEIQDYVRDRMVTVGNKITVDSILKFVEQN